MFGGWDIFADNCYEAALHAGVIEAARLEAVRQELEAIQPSKAYRKNKGNYSGPGVVARPGAFSL